MTDARDEETKILESLRGMVHSNEIKCVVQLLTLRREKHRNSLEAEENDQMRGRAKECKDLLNLLVS